MVNYLIEQLIVLSPAIVFHSVLVRRYVDRYCYLLDVCEGGGEREPLLPLWKGRSMMEVRRLLKIDWREKNEERSCGNILMDCSPSLTCSMLIVQ
jgi:hypothetical protein